MLKTRNYLKQVQMQMQLTGRSLTWKRIQAIPFSIYHVSYGISSFFFELWARELFLVALVHLTYYLPLHLDLAYAV